MQWFLFIALSACAAHAKPTTTPQSDRIPLGQIFSQATNEQPLCYGREFSTEYMEKHPDQQIRQMRAKVVRDLTDPAQPNQYIELDLGLKGEKNFSKLYRAYLVCAADTGICTVECEGGSVQAWGLRDGALEIQNNGFVIDGSCDARKAKRLEVRGNESFMLAPLPADFCQL